MVAVRSERAGRAASSPDPFVHAENRLSRRFAAGGRLVASSAPIRWNPLGAGGHWRANWRTRLSHRPADSVATHDRRESAAEAQAATADRFESVDARRPEARQ